MTEMCALYVAPRIELNERADGGDDDQPIPGISYVRSGRLVRYPV
jgi:hypothetical protein